MLGEAGRRPSHSGGLVSGRESIRVVHLASVHLALPGGGGVLIGEPWRRTGHTVRLPPPCSLLGARLPTGGTCFALLLCDRKSVRAGSDREHLPPRCL